MTDCFNFSLLSYTNLVTTTSYFMYIIDYSVNIRKYNKTFYIQNVRHLALHMYGSDMLNS